MRSFLNVNTFLFFVFGLVIGLGIYAFIEAKGWSYLSDDPKACVNCHVMQENMDTWIKSTHHHVAKCNDCHLPHNFAGKYAVKALNGWNHSVAFTLQNFKEPILIKEHSSKVVQQSCLSCHQSMIQASHADKSKFDENTNCTTCHRSVGHAK